MQTTCRPVPSTATLRFLRQLTYVASGTTCGAAALVYEERRRRIQYLSQVVENGRVLKDVSREQKTRHSTFAVAEREPDAFDEHSILAEQASRGSTAGPPPLTAGKRVRRREYELPAPSVQRGAYLPSEVDKDYRKWTIRDAARSGSAGSVEAKPVAAEARRVRKAVATSSGSVATKSRTQHSITQEARERFDSQMAQWYLRLNLLEDTSDALEESWALFLDKCKSPRPSKPLFSFHKEPSSVTLFAAAIVDSLLPDLLLRFCEIHRTTSDWTSLLPVISSSLLAHPEAETYSDVAHILLKWTTEPPPDNKTHSSNAWSTISLYTICPVDVFRERSATLLPLFKGAIDSEDGAALTFRRLRDRLSTLLRAKKSGIATPMLVQFVRHEVKVGSAVNKLLAWYVEEASRYDGSWSSIVTILALRKRLREDRNTSAVSLQQLELDSESVLLDAYGRLGGTSIPDKETLRGIAKVMVAQAPAEFVKKTLLGRDEKLWTSALIQAWAERALKPEQVIAQYWHLQECIGDRLLNTLLYEYVLRLCSEHKLEQTSARIEEHRAALSAKHSNLGRMGAIMHAVEHEDWPAVTTNIKELNVAGFGSMSNAQRTQLFDGLFDAYASEGRSMQDLLDMGFDVLSRVCEDMTRLKALRLLCVSLVRKGKVSVVVALHAHAEAELGHAIYLSPVNAVWLFEAFYYGLRPSEFILAGMLHRIFCSAWQLVSRMFLPLLLTGCVYERAHIRRSRVGAMSRTLIRGVLLRADNELYRKALVYNASYAHARYNINKTFKRIKIGAGSGIKDEPPRPAPTRRAYAEDPSEDKPGSRSQTKSDRAHFQQARAQALMLDKGSEVDRLGIYKGIAAGDTQPQSDTMTSLVARQLLDAPDEVQVAFRELVVASGSDYHGSRISSWIHAMQKEGRAAGASDGAKADVDVQLLIMRLKAMIESDWSGIEETSRHISYSLTTAAARLVLALGHPTAAITIIQHAQQLPWARLIPPSTALMTALLQAHIQTGQLAGVRRTVHRVLALNLRMHRSFVAALRFGQMQVWAGSEGRDRRAREEFVRELSAMQDLCVQRKLRQVDEAMEAGRALARYVAGHAPPVRTIQEGRLSERDYERYTDAVLVDRLCVDLTEVKRRAHSHRKGGAYVTGKTWVQGAVRREQRWAEERTGEGRRARAAAALEKRRELGSVEPDAGVGRRARKRARQRAKKLARKALEKGLDMVAVGGGAVVH